MKLRKLIGGVLTVCIAGSVLLSSSMVMAKTDKINNSSLMPKYKPDSEVKMVDGSPEWASSLIMASFRIESATKEGTFQSATKVLDHYQEMGVNGIWVLPVYQRGANKEPSGNNGYGNWGPHTIEPDLTGTNDINKSFEVVKKFVDEAHKRNIRVLFDIVVWGAEKDSPIVKEHPEYFGKNADGTFREVWGGYAFNWTSAEWQKWYVGCAVDFIMKTGADGFRVDLEPTITGYGVFGEIRKQLEAKGRKVVIMSEGTNERKGVYDFSTSDIGYFWNEKTGKEDFDIMYNMSNNIVDTVKQGKLDAAALQNYNRGGRFKYYVVNFCSHDSYTPQVHGNRNRMAYNGFFAPYLPLWFIGEEWNNPNNKQHDGTIFYNKIDWDVKEQAKNNQFFEDIKKYIQIRRTYSSIFEYFPTNHRETNICKITSQYYASGNVYKDNLLQAYARYADNKGIMIVPNELGGDAYFKITPDYKSMQIDGANGYKITNLYTGKVVAENKSGKIESFEDTISDGNLGIYLIEKLDASGTIISTPATPKPDVSQTTSATDSSQTTSATDTGVEMESDANDSQSTISNQVEGGESGSLLWLWLLLGGLVIVAVGAVTLTFFLVKSKDESNDPPKTE